MTHELRAVPVERCYPSPVTGVYVVSVLTAPGVRQSLWFTESQYPDPKAAADEFIAVQNGLEPKPPDGVWREGERFFMPWHWRYCVPEGWRRTGAEFVERWIEVERVPISPEPEPQMVKVHVRDALDRLTLNDGPVMACGRDDDGELYVDCESGRRIEADADGMVPVLPEDGEA